VINMRGRIIPVLDLELPKIYGLEMLRKVKSDERTKHIPFVVITSSSEENDIVTSYNLNRYILKPVESDKFVEAIKDTGCYWLLLNQPPR
jgi:two-component system response regulator